MRRPYSIAPGAPARGERRWSPFFGRWVYLAEYLSDGCWYFTFDVHPKGKGTAQPIRAQTPWSQMPTTKPGGGA
jgi:hypothetical protein